MIVPPAHSYDEVRIMAEKILRINQRRGFYMGGGIHLVNPERPFIKLPEDYVPTKDIVRAIKTGAIIDVNQNILNPEGKQEQPKEKVEPKVEAEKESEPKAETKTKTTRAKSKTAAK